MALERNYSANFDERVDAPFWRGLERNEIRIQRCDRCLNWTWPAEWRCGECGSWDFHWEGVRGEGVIYAWQRTHHPFVPGFADLIPYVNVVVELPNAANRRLVGLLVGDTGNVRIGAQVQAEIHPPSPRTLDLAALCWRLKPDHA
jgi:uncharacterized protein